MVPRLFTVTTKVDHVYYPNLSREAAQVDHGCYTGKSRVAAAQLDNMNNQEDHGGWLPKLIKVFTS